MTDQPAKREKSRDYDLIGKTVADKYRVLRLLGQGGYGAVYLVEIVAGMLGEKLALKVLPAEFSQDEGIRERFLNEIRVAMKLVNKYIVQIRDVGVTDDGQLYYTMDYSPGVTLTEVLTANKRLSVMKTLSLVRRVLRGLITAHKQGVIHRDLKPGNLMVEDRSKGETIRILDFGIATALQSTKRTEAIVGSPLYMPPEQYVGHEIGFYTDLYAVGVVLYECLSGERPYTGSTPKEILDKMKSGPPTAIQELCPELSQYPGLAEVIMKALERDPARRFQSAQELFNELTAIGKAAQARQAEDLATSHAPTVAAPVSRTLGRRRTQSASKAFAVVLLLAVVGGAVYYLWPYFADVREAVVDNAKQFETPKKYDEDSAPAQPRKRPALPKRSAIEDFVDGDSDSGVIDPESDLIEPPEQLTPEEQAKALLSKARDYQEEERWADVVDVTQEAVALAGIPGDLKRTALEMRASALSAQSRFSDAADTFDRIVEEFGEEQVDDALLFRRFEARSRGGPLTDAIANGEQLRQRGYDDPKVLIMLLEMVEQLEDVAKIKLYLEVADRRGLDDPVVKRLHAKYSKPEYTPKIIAEHGDRAEEAYLDGEYSEVITKNVGVFKETRDPKIGYALARAYLASHDNKGALGIIKALYDLPEISPKRQLRLRILAGRAKIPHAMPLIDDRVGSKRYDTAAAQADFGRALNRLLGLDGLDKSQRKALRAEIHTYLGVCFALEGKFDRTDREILRNGDAFRSRDAELVLEQGRTYLILANTATNPKHRQRAYERTVARMKRFYEIVGRTADPRGFVFMGVGYFEQGKSDYGKAIKAFRVAIRENEKCSKRVRVDPVDLEKRLARAYEMRGETGSRQADFRQAGDHYKKAFDLETDAQICFAAARNYFRGDRKKRGCEVLVEGMAKVESTRLRQLHERYCAD